MINFIEIIRICKPSKIIFFSSISVYGEKKHHRHIDESSKTNPDNDYGVAKIISEKMFFRKK